MTSTPSRPVQGRPNERRRTVHIVIHRLWRQDSRRRSVVYRRGRRGPGLVTAVVRSVGSRRGRASSLRCLVAVPVSKRHWQKLTVFRPSANRSATLLGRRFLPGSRSAVTAVAIVRLVSRGRSARGLTKRNLVSTLEQSPERGDTAATQDVSRRPRRLASETDELTNGDRVHTGMRIHRRECGCQTQRGVNSRGQGQADLPAQQPAPGAGARVPAADAHPGRPGDRVRAGAARAAAR